MVHKLCEHFSPLLHVEQYPKGTRLCHSLDVNELAESDTDDLCLAYHPFPTPSRLAEPDVEGRLRELGFGYRAKYLAQTAYMLCEKARESLGLDASAEKVNERVYANLLELRSLSYYDARSQLLPLSGIGPKVADCILLMSLDQASSIPVDRHVFQFAERWYGIRSKRYEEVADKLRAVWGERAGWAHSFLFYADLPSLNFYDPDDHIGAYDGEEDKKQDILSSSAPLIKLDQGMGPAVKSDTTRYPYPTVKSEPDQTSLSLDNINSSHSFDTPGITKQEPSSPDGPHQQRTSKRARTARHRAKP
ncbi:DNA-(apurinic or apyrimidinic site) lyase [Malassezia psittaci]|uniref:DNA-(apurinic or apyrimidinic site) lyase n=1 Tax=Malassezia psittaci TaxID=1821823 RepID=A0AAF0JDN9_9BASI|nr:DNA-(apurinic or apyrimidinic site) lyase [Malassezia psittaci]